MAPLTLPWAMVATALLGCFRVPLAAAIAVPPFLKDLVHFRLDSPQPQPRPLRIVPRVEAVVDDGAAVMVIVTTTVTRLETVTTTDTVTADSSSSSSSSGSSTDSTSGDTTSAAAKSSTDATTAPGVSHSCDLRYCEYGTSYCEYWGGYSTFDVSQGRPIPGETRSSIGTCTRIVPTPATPTSSSSSTTSTSSTSSAIASTSSDTIASSTCTTGH